MITGIPGHRSSVARRSRMARSWDCSPPLHVADENTRNHDTRVQADSRAASPASSTSKITQNYLCLG